MEHCNYLNISESRLFPTLISLIKAYIFYYQLLHAMRRTTATSQECQSQSLQFQSLFFLIQETLMKFLHTPVARAIYIKLSFRYISMEGEKSTHTHKYVTEVYFRLEGMNCVVTEIISNTQYNQIFTQACQEKKIFTNTQSPSRHL